MRCILVIGSLLATTVLAAEDMKILEFLQLPAADQDRIFMSSYHTATSLLALGGVGLGESKLAPEKMAACLREREVEWLRQTFIEYTTTHPTMTVDFGAAFAQSMAWKCGLLTFRDERY